MFGDCWQKGGRRPKLILDGFPKPNVQEYTSQASPLNRTFYLEYQVFSNFSPILPYSTTLV